MTIQHQREAIIAPVSPHLSAAARAELLARWVSRVGSPPVLATTGIIIAAQSAQSRLAWSWAGFYILVAIFLPVVYILWLVRQGKVTDFDLSRREQRRNPFIVTLLSSLVAWLALDLAQAPAQLVLLAGAGWVQIVLLLAITLHWKISAHCASAASFVVWLWAIFGPTATPFILLIPLIAWSRLRLQRHDLPQTVAGALLGSTVLAITLHLAGQK
jgi:hypothetical protein